MDALYEMNAEYEPKALGKVFQRHLLEFGRLL